MSELKDKILLNIDKGMHLGLLSKEDLFEILKHVGPYLDICTIPKYSKANKLSYNGVKNFRDVRELYGTKYVLDMD